MGKDNKEPLGKNVQRHFYPSSVRKGKRKDNGEKNKEKGSVNQLISKQSINHK